VLVGTPSNLSQLLKAILTQLLLGPLVKQKRGRRLEQQQDKRVERVDLLLQVAQLLTLMLVAVVLGDRQSTTPLETKRL
tara:strand:- start:75 stop:311 length:237 start_codon:yes stop_codon:yes gene_type:complete